MISSGNYTVGLRVDVDTYRGTRDGVPQLLQILEKHDIRASFFFSVGPDNMGRHLWRLLKPAFLVKMLRSKAASLYGWDILLRGTLWPGPKIGKRLAEVIRTTDIAGHEIGLHAWDHHRWQIKVERMPRNEIREEIQRGMNTLKTILNRQVTCSAAAGWKCTPDVLQEKNAFWFQYNSDCRGRSIFKPVINDSDSTPQIPVTLPTYDEVIGRGGITDANYNEQLLSQLKPDRLNVLTIHAEVEGISRHPLFSEFLQLAKRQQVLFLPLGKLLPQRDQIPPGDVDSGPIEGREGDVCRQI